MGAKAIPTETTSEKEERRDMANFLENAREAASDLGRRSVAARLDDPKD